MEDPDLHFLWNLSDTQFLEMVDTFVWEQELLNYQDLYTHNYSMWVERNKRKREIIEQNLLNNYKMA